MSDEKRILWDYLDVYNSPDSPRNTHLLSERDVQALAAISTAILWKSRWLNTPVGQWDNVEAYISDLLQRVYFPVDFCQLVNQCLDTNPGFISQSIGRAGGRVDYMPDSATAAQYIPNPQNPVRELSGCNLDKLWAGIREMVERIDQEGRDLLQDLASLNDVLERIQAFVDLVPIFGDTIADTAEWFTETIPDILNAYDSFSSPTELDQVACDLFEIACNTCQYPSYNDILTYFFSRSIAGQLDPMNAEKLDIWDGLRVTSLVGAITWYSVNSLQVWVLSVGGSWYASWQRRTFSVWASFGEDVPNDNWLTLCGGCQDNDLFNWENVVNTDFNPPTRGEIVAGQWADTDTRRVSVPTEWFRGIEIRRDVDAAVSNVFIRYGFLAGDFNDGQVPSRFIHRRGGVDLVNQVIGNPPADTSSTDINIPVSAQAGDEFIIRLTSDHAAQIRLTGSCAVRRIELT